MSEEKTKKELKKEKKLAKKNKPYSKGKKIRRTIIGGFLIYLSFVMLYSYIWSLFAFTNLTVENMLFQLKVPVGGTELSSFMSLIILDTVGALASAIALVLLYKLTVYIVGKIKKKKYGFSYRWFPRVSAIICLIAFLVIAGLMGFYEYIVHQFSKTTLYDDYYVDPEYTEIEFPEQKRNLIYIMLESMEISFTDSSVGGIAKDNYIPKLTELAFDNDMFAASGSTTLNGPIAPLNTEWTVASYVAQTTGLPLSIPIARNAMNNRTSFLPGAYSAFQILEENGYNQSLIIGSQETFSGIDVFIKSHGNTSLKGYNYYNNHGKLPFKNYFVWWGYEDKYLFKYAKEEIEELYAKGEPFAVSMMTIDTHRTGGYKCTFCKDEYSDQYSNVLACSDRQVAEFVDWINEQPFADNTTIVIVGDHPTMDGDYVYHLPGYSDKYQRKQYFTIINSAVKPVQNKDREYTTMDIFPTFLTAMGAKIEGDKLGLGVNLYSDQETLVEKMGIDKLNDEIAKKSKYYEKYFLYGNYSPNKE